MVNITIIRDLADGKLTSSAEKRLSNKPNIINERLSEPYCWKCATWLYQNDNKDKKLCKCPVSTFYTLIYLYLLN